MVRAHHLALAITSGRSLPAICDSLQPDGQRGRSHTSAPRLETAFLRHLSEYRRQRSFLGTALRGLQSRGLRRMASLSPGRLWRISRLGPRTPAVFLRRLCRRVRLRGRQRDPRSQHGWRHRDLDLFLGYWRRHARHAGPDRAPLREGSVRAYSASSEEALRARDLLKEWAGEGFLTEAQYQRMEQETVCELRRTNIFLRLVLFLFALIIVCAAVALVIVVFLSRPGMQTTGIFLLIFAAISYAAAELAVSRARLYRYGIEEALAACSAGFLYAGMQSVLFSGYFLAPAA